METTKKFNTLVDIIKASNPFRIKQKREKAAKVTIQYTQKQSQKTGKYYKTDIKHSRKYQLQYFQVQIGIDIVHSIKGWDFYGKVIAID